MRVWSFSWFELVLTDPEKKIGGEGGGGGGGGGGGRRYLQVIIGYY